MAKTGNIKFNKREQYYVDGPNAGVTITGSQEDNLDNTSTSGHPYFSPVTQNEAETNSDYAHLTIPNCSSTNTATTFTFTFTDGSTFITPTTPLPAFVYVNIQSDGTWTINLEDTSNLGNKFTSSSLSSLSGSGNQNNIQIKVNGFDAGQAAIQVSHTLTSINQNLLTINNPA